MMDNKLQRIYYSPKGYWRGLAAVKKLAVAAKVSEADARSWLKKQAIWQCRRGAAVWTLTETKASWNGLTAR